MAHSLFRKVSQIFRSNDGNILQSHVQDQRTLAQGALSNATAPCDSPPIVPFSTSTDIPRNILAFRTITKLLAKIQQEQSFQVSSKERLPLQSAERQELLLSNAFSTVANMDNDVVAVVTRHTSGQILDDATCTTENFINEEPLITPPPSTLVSQVWHLVVTRNYCWDEIKPATILPVDPVIGDARILAEIGLVEDEALKLIVDQYW
jgi:hypothetical protein